jgi:hypothetical protein
LASSSAPQVLTRAEMRAAGAHLYEPPLGEERFLVQSAIPDSGEVLAGPSVPPYVRRERYGAVTGGWDADATRG